MNASQQADYIVAYKKAIETGDYTDINTVTTRILKERNTGPYEFTLHHPFRYNETPEQRAKRELGFPIEGIEP